jgi:SAM-dependent methyltransferase
LEDVEWDQGDAYALPYPDGSFSIVVSRYALHHLLDPEAALREMVRVCASGGRIVVVDAYASENPTKAAAYNRLEKLRDPSHARALSLAELIELFSCVGLAEPEPVLYDLPVELADLMARAFPNPGDGAEIAVTFAAAVDDDCLGIPVYREGDTIRIAYRAAILTAVRAERSIRALC